MTLLKILNSHIKKNNEEITHTRIKSELHNISGGAYNIEGASLKTFHELYYKEIISKGLKEYITEKQPKDMGSLCIDFDFRYDPNITTRQHGIEDIEFYCALLLDELKKLVNCDKPFKLYIFEKDSVNICKDLSITKDGIHIIIGAHVKREIGVHLRNGFLDKIKTSCNLPLTNTWDKVYDEGIAKGTTAWQLYGSCKPGHLPYKLKHIFEVSYDDNVDEFDSTAIKVPKNEDMPFELFQQLSIQYENHPKLEITEFGEKLMDYSKSKPKKKLNIVIKEVNHDDILKITSHVELDIKVDEFLESLDINDFYIKECHHHTMILPESYYESGCYEKWIKVAMALHATDQRLFISWVKMSSKSKTFKFEDISDLKVRWDSLAPHSLTGKSIRYWAQTDAPKDAYEGVQKISISHDIEKSIDPTTSVTEHDIAKVIHRLYKDRYICVSIKRNIWFEFKGHKWCEIESGNTLRLKLSEDVFELFFEKLKTMTELSGTDDGYDQVMSEKSKKKLSKCSEICTMLKRTQNKNNIMREAQELFYDSAFEEKLNKNQMLLCFNNGVFDFNEGGFRPGRCTDYITKSTKIDYVEISKCNQNTIEEINDFMCKLFPVEELRNYMWSHLASTLIGTNENQTFNIYTGSGRNGKSKLVELMTHCLGDYKGTLPISVVTTARARTGQVSPEIVQLQGVRYAVMQEPSKGDKIVEGNMKELTGGDPVVCRGLYKDSVTFVPQFKLVVCTNTLFDITSNDDGTWRRIRVCDFMAKFKEKDNIDNDPEEPYQFEVDKKLDSKFPEWKEVFMSMLIEKVVYTNGIVDDCDIVMAKSGEYRSSQDYLEGYVKERIEKADETKYIIWSELQEDFKDWYIQLYGTKVPRGQELKDYMNKKFGKPQRILDGEKRKQGWLGITLSTNDDEDNFNV